MPIQPGKMDRRVTLSHNTPTLDGAGVPQPTWTPYATMWAQLLTNTTKEADLRAFGEETDIGRVWVMRWIDGLLLGDAVTYEIDGLQYRIVSIREIGRREALEVGTLLVQS